MALTPTEELIMEVLGARLRLGEDMWTLGDSTKAAARKLEARDLITMTHGIVEKTYRASLTRKGTDMALSSDYTSPLEDRSARLERKVKKLKRLI